MCARISNAWLPWALLILATALLYPRLTPGLVLDAAFEDLAVIDAEAELGLLE